MESPSWTILDNTPIDHLHGVAGDYRPTPQAVDGTRYYISPYAGLNVAYLAGDNAGNESISQQVLTTNIVPGIDYTLSVAVGREYQFTPEPFGIQLLAGGNVILSYSSTTGDITPGSS